MKNQTKSARKMLIAKKKKNVLLLKGSVDVLVVVDGRRERAYKPQFARKVGKNCWKMQLATFCICELMPTAWARTFMEKTSAVQIQVVAPQDGL